MAFTPKNICDYARIKLVKKGLSKEDIDTLLEGLVSELKKSEEVNGSLSPRAKDEAVDSWLVKKEIQQKQMLHQQLLQRQMMYEYSRYRVNFKNGEQALVAYLRGSNKIRMGALKSVDYMTKALENKAVGDFENDIVNAGLSIKEFFKVNEKDLAIELENLQEGGSPGITGNVLARQFAEIINKHQGYWVDRLNRAGAYINKLKGYITRQTHDRKKILKVSIKEWITDIKKEIDFERTFKDIDIDITNTESVDEFFRNVHKDIMAGKYDIDNGIGGNGRLNIANKVGKERVLHFKDGESWLRYNEKYGAQDLQHSILSGLKRSAKNAGLIESLGPSPETTIDILIKEIRDDWVVNKENYPKNIEGKLENIKNIYHEISGEANIPVNFKAAVWATIRQIENMAKLGFSMVASLSDVASVYSNLAWAGVPFADRVGTSMKVLFTGMPKNEQAEFARLLGLGMDEIINSVGARFTNVEGLGSMDSWQRAFFKYSGLEWWTVKAKQITGLSLSTHIGQHVNMTFDKLPSKLQRLFKQYGITKEKWNIIRKAETIEHNGNRYLIPENIQDLPDNVFSKIVGKSRQPDIVIQRYKDSLDTQIRTMFASEMDRAVPTPGAREQSYIHWGQRPGTVWGEVGRFVMQFKTFPMTFATKNLGRFMSTGFKSAETYSNMAQLILGTTFMGYVSLISKDILNGKSIRDITDTDYTFKILSQSFLQGGAAGLYGDFIFGALNTSYGHGILEDLAGPVAGAVVDLASIVFKDMAHGNFKKVPNKTIGLIKNNTPYMNMWFAKGALDNLLWYHLQEATNPGYLRRKKRNLKKATGQEFFIKP